MDNDGSDEETGVCRVLCLNLLESLDESTTTQAVLTLKVGVNMFPLLVEVTCV